MLKEFLNDRKKRSTQPVFNRLISDSDFFFKDGKKIRILPVNPQLTKASLHKFLFVNEMGDKTSKTFIHDINDAGECNVCRMFEEQEERQFKLHVNNMDVLNFVYIDLYAYDYYDNKIKPLFLGYKQEASLVEFVNAHPDIDLDSLSNGVDLLIRHNSDTNYQFVIETGSKPGPVSAEIKKQFDETSFEKVLKESLDDVSSINKWFESNTGGNIQNAVEKSDNMKASTPVVDIETQTTSNPIEDMPDDDF